MELDTTVRRCRMLAQIGCGSYAPTSGRASIKVESFRAQLQMLLARDSGWHYLGWLDWFVIAGADSLPGV